MSATLLAIVTSLLAAPSEADEFKKIAVPDMTLANVDEALGRTLTEILTTELSGVEGLSVIGSSDIATMLGFERQKELLGCSDDVACIAEIGGALGVQYLLVSDLGRLGKTYVLNVKLIDSRTVAVLKRVYKTVPGEPDALIVAVQEALPTVIAAIAPEAVKKARPGRAKEPKKPKPTEPTKTAAAPPPKPTAKPAPVPKPTPEPEPASAKRPTWPKWTLIGVGGLAFASGVTAEIFASRDNSAAEKTFTVGEESTMRSLPLRASDAAERGEAARRTSIIGVSLMTGGLLLAGGGLLWLLLGGDAEAEANVAIAPAMGGLAIGGTF